MCEYNIRAMNEADLLVVLPWRNHPDVRRYMYTQHEITLAEHCSWFARATENPHKHLLIFEVDGSATGFVNLSCQPNERIADWGFYLAPGSAKGHGTALGKTALDYAFDRLQLHKVCGEAIDYNERSVRFHQRLGFQLEGTLRDQHFDGQNFHAVLRFGLIHTEWNYLELN